MDSRATNLLGARRVGMVENGSVETSAASHQSIPVWGSKFMITKYPLTVETSRSKDEKGNAFTH